ncbi:hypothetical protein Tco_0662390 [Tanacetum coccineum]
MIISIELIGQGIARVSNKKTLDWRATNILATLSNIYGSLYYTNPSERNLVGFADAEYMSGPHTSRSQPRYVFTSSNAVISRRSIKQAMSATSSNHVKILSIHEVSREYVWLRSVTQHIRESCGISLGQESPTVVHEDNADMYCST